MSGKQDPAGGVRVFSITGRLSKTRERLLGMTDEERRWRAQWLKDQELCPEEPRYVPEYYKSTTNIFRRLWRIPGRNYEMILTPFLGKEKANLARYFTGTLIKSLIGIFGLTYFIKYHANNFSLYRSWEVLSFRSPMYPDEPDYPNFYRKTPEDFYDMGFYSSVLCVDAVPPPPPPPPPPAVERPPVCGPEE